MDKNKFSENLPVDSINITDNFWRKMMELVRTHVIPYQWEALNDRIEAVGFSLMWHKDENLEKTADEAIDIEIKFEDKKLNWIPYYSLVNRNPGEMIVWVRTTL